MPPSVQVAAPPGKPLLIFDGDCGFCRRWIRRWQEATGDRVDYAPSSSVSFPEIPQELFQQAVVLIEPDGQVYHGAEAVFRVRGGVWSYDHVPGFAPISEAAYRFVARHRTGSSMLTRWLWGKYDLPPTYDFTRNLFLRLLGVIYLIAFVSFGTQINGLIGSHGIRPAAPFMERVREVAQFWQLPTLCWFNASDWFLHALCAAGCVAAVVLIIGFWRVPALALLWTLYLSLVSVSGVFLQYQWDALLLETGFLAIFFAIGRPQPWLLRLLLFKLMFCSGFVKLASGDPLWHNLTALTAHYETQPLPTWIGWWAHQLPVAVQKFSCAVMFGIELGLPWLIFAPRRLRFVAAGGFALLMVLISLTGNYTFFNLLTMTLCVTLLDDQTFGRSDQIGTPTLKNSRRRWVVIPVAALYLFLSFHPLTWVTPFDSLNSYGLFAVMTPTRPELVVEGSDDAITWKAYEFKYKPGDLARRPGFVAPHQPRLDWQMWFEALHTLSPHPNPSPWFINFCVRLLQGQPEVLALLKTNPFPNSPPRYLRVRVYRYELTNRTEHAATGHWWQRQYVDEYCPVLSLRPASTHRTLARNSATQSCEPNRL